MNAPIMLTIREAAAQANVPVHALRQWVAAGTVHSVRSGSRFYVSWASLTQFLNGEATVEPRKEDVS